MVKSLNKDDINTVPFVVSQQWELFSCGNVYLLNEDMTCPVISSAFIDPYICAQLIITLGDS